MAKGYIVANIHVHDLENWPAYGERSRPYVERCGGRYIIVSHHPDERETPFGFNRLVIIEFPSLEAARQAYESEEYQTEIMPFRTRASTSQFAIVEGLE